MTCGFSPMKRQLKSLIKKYQSLQRCRNKDTYRNSFKKKQVVRTVKTIHERKEYRLQRKDNIQINGTVMCCYTFKQIKMYSTDYSELL